MKDDYWNRPINILSSFAGIVIALINKSNFHKEKVRKLHLLLSCCNYPINNIDLKCSGFFSSVKTIPM